MLNQSTSKNQDGFCVSKITIDFLIVRNYTAFVLCDLKKIFSYLTDNIMERIRNLIRIFVEPSSSAVQRHIDRAEEVERRLYKIKETLAQEINSDSVFFAMRSMDSALDELIKVRCERIPRERSLWLGSFRISLPPKYMH